jgi:hypothetical protein
MAENLYPDRIGTKFRGMRRTWKYVVMTRNKDNAADNGFPTESRIKENEEAVKQNRFPLHRENSRRVRSFIILYRIHRRNPCREASFFANLQVHSPERCGFFSWSDSFQTDFGKEYPMEYEVIETEMEDEFKVCPSCGSKDGFHSMFKREDDTIKWLFICPACHKVFDIGFTA